MQVIRTRDGQRDEIICGHEDIVIADAPKLDYTQGCSIDLIVPKNICLNYLEGSTGDDKIAGTNGSDLIRVLKGADVLGGLLGSDCVIGEGGNDKLRARDGKRDVVDCGKGRDVAIVDRKDVVKRSCEKVRRR